MESDGVKVETSTLNQETSLKFNVEPLIAALHDETDVNQIHLEHLKSMIHPLVNISSNGLSVQELATISSVIFKNEKLAANIQKRFQLSMAGKENDPVCAWLYEWYRSDVKELQLFVLRFIPNLVGVYLYNHQKGRELSGILAIFLCIYNSEVVTRDGKEIVWIPPTPGSFRYGSTSQNQIREKEKDLGRRKTIGGPTSALTDSNLKKLDTQIKFSEPRVIEDQLLPIGAGDLKHSDIELAIRVSLEHYVAVSNMMPLKSIKSFCFLVEKLMIGGTNLSITREMKSSHLVAVENNGIMDVVSEANLKQETKEKKEVKSFGLNHIHETRYNIGVHTTQILVNGITLTLSRKPTQKRAVQSLLAIHERAKNDLNAKILLSTNSLVRKMEREGVI